MNHLDAEYEGFINQSVIERRETLTKALSGLSQNSSAYRCVVRMRAACNTYLDRAHDPITEPFTHLRPHFREALVDLRRAFVAELRRLSDELKLPSASELADRIPLDVEAYPAIEPGGTVEIYIAPPPAQLGEGDLPDGDAADQPRTQSD